MNDFNYKDFYLNIPKNIYLPSDDTFLMLDVLKDKITFKVENILEIGPGSGFLSIYLSKFCNNMYLADIDENVVNYLEVIKKKYNFKNWDIYFSDLFSKLPLIKFDVIVFNPPYVPSEDFDIKCTDGGNCGSEIIIKFINSLKNYLNKEGRCYLLVSTLNNIPILEKLINKNKLKMKILSEKKLFFEKLLVLEIKL